MLVWRRLDSVYIYIYTINNVVNPIPSTSHLGMIWIQPIFRIIHSGYHTKYDYWWWHRIPYIQIIGESCKLSNMLLSKNGGPAKVPMENHQNGDVLSWIFAIFDTVSWVIGVPPYFSSIRVGFSLIPSSYPAAKTQFTAAASSGPALSGECNG